MQELLRVLMGEELREALPQLQHNLTEDKLVRLIEAGQVHPPALSCRCGLSLLCAPPHGSAWRCAL